VTRRLGNYVLTSRPCLGNYVIADRRTKYRRLSTDVEQYTTLVTPAWDALSHDLL
jgi:hypothetical protein